jgi:hypothetical protein
MTSPTICGSCDGEIKEFDERVFCYGNCCNIFHVKCSKIKNTASRLINENPKNIKFLCDKCSNNDFGKINESFYQLVKNFGSYEKIIMKQQEMIEKQENMLKFQEDQIKLLLDEMKIVKNFLIETNNNTNTNSGNMTYSEALKIKAKKPNDQNSVVLIKAKNRSKNRTDIREELRNKVNPEEIPVNGLINAANDGVLIKCKNKVAT